MIEPYRPSYPALPCAALAFPILSVASEHYGSSSPCGTLMDSTRIPVIVDTRQNDDLGRSGHQRHFNGPKERVIVLSGVRATALAPYKLVGYTRWKGRSHGG